jgi:hypothetical protein
VVSDQNPPRERSTGGRSSLAYRVVVAAVEQRGLLVGAAVAGVYRACWVSRDCTEPCHKLAHHQQSVVARQSLTPDRGASGTSGPGVNWLTACRTKRVVFCALFRKLARLSKPNLLE